MSRHSLAKKQRSSSKYGAVQSSPSSAARLQRFFSTLAESLTKTKMSLQANSISDTKTVLQISASSCHAVSKRSNNQERPCAWLPPLPRFLSVRLCTSVCVCVYHLWSHQAQPSAESKESRGRHRGALSPACPKRAAADVGPQTTAEHALVTRYPHSTDQRSCF